MGRRVPASLVHHNENNAFPPPPSFLSLINFRKQAFALNVHSGLGFRPGTLLNVHISTNMTENYSDSAGGPYPAGGNQRTVETLYEDTIHVERKALSLSLKQNSRGRFLRITEEVGGRRDAVVVPASGLEEFRNALERVIAADDANPQDD